MNEPYELYDGQVYCGRIVKVGRAKFEVYDYDGQHWGTYKSLREAMQQNIGPRSETDYFGD
jgi:hypothetical protein